MHFSFGNKYKYKVDILPPSAGIWILFVAAVVTSLYDRAPTAQSLSRGNHQHQDVAITVGSFVRRSCTTPKGRKTPPPPETRGTSRSSLRRQVGGCFLYGVCILGNALRLRAERVRLRSPAEFFQIHLLVARRGDIP